MKYEIEIPDGVIPAGVEKLVWKRPLDGESYIDKTGSVLVAMGDYYGHCFPVIVPVKKLRPLTIKEASDAMNEGRKVHPVYQFITGVRTDNYIWLNGVEMSLQAACDQFKVGVME